ncbi:MAG TPA: HD domain-containing phosphohydrolase [Gemmatimonadales bacterium]|nr:HD domain-containing phosphohydrolase [Gemmatimonadales bacterium]
MAAHERFLNALGHALELRFQEATAALQRAAEEACAERAAALMEERRRPVFHFSPGGVRYGLLPLADFENWTWARLLHHRGVARLELVSPPTPAMIAAMLDIATGQLAMDAAVLRGGLRWNSVDVDQSEDEDEYPLDEELAVMEQLYRDVARGESVRQGDMVMVLASLEAVLAGARGPTLPLLHRYTREGYLASHALNTALLAFATAEALRLPPDERRETALAALLHDVGMAALPAEEVSGEAFTSHSRAVVRGHPLEGARLLLRQSDAFEIAAVVSYEHHLHTDGTGYPRLNYPREPHLLSRIVAVCDAFDALLAPRPDRPGFTIPEASREIQRGAGTQFDQKVVLAFYDVVMRATAHNDIAVTLRTH